MFDYCSSSEPAKRDAKKENGGLARNAENNITVATARHDFAASRVKKTQIMFLYEKLAKLSLPMLELTVACS
jgi:hypothetical protein